MGDDSWSTRPVRALLDQQMPLGRCSAEDRLNTLILLLRDRSATTPADLRDHGRLLGTPPGAIEAILNGDMHTLNTVLCDSGGWPMLASLLAYGPGLGADLDTLALAQAEYEEIALGDERVRPALAPVDLHRRGYRAARRTRTPVEEVTDPKQVNTFSELVQALTILRAARGDPPFRDMASRSEKPLPGWNPDEHESRSHTGMRAVIKEGAAPRLTAVLAFVRGCGITDPQMGRAWAAAHARAAVHEELTRSRKPPPSLEDTVEEWASRSPTGPNPSLGS